MATTDKRIFTIEARAAADESDSALYVEGYAATFNSPTVLYSFDGVDYKEVIDARAFDGVDMSDVIFNYDHSGKVMARTRNNTLELSTDTRGLRIRARLDGTTEGRSLYQEIQGGYVDRMSFQFSVAEDKYDRSTHTRTIMRVKKLYDVSAVSIPAYDDTSIQARNYFEAEADKLKAEEKRARLLLALDTII